MKKKPARTVASLCLRDERQLASHLAKKKRKYKAWQPDDSDISLWGKGAFLMLQAFSTFMEFTDQLANGSSLKEYINFKYHLLAI